MANIINSRVILRNDILSSWEHSDKKLLKGEMALALHTAGEFKDKYEIRIGDGAKTFSELAPTNIVIPYTAISGMPAAAEYELSVNGLSACVVKDGQQAGSVFSVQALSDAISAVADSISNATSGLALSVSNLSGELLDQTTGYVKQLCSDTQELCTTVTATISNAITGISNEISAPTTGLSAKVTSISTDIYAASTGLSAKQTAISNDIYTAGTGLSAQVASNDADIADLSTALTAASTGLCARVDALENSTARGVNFVGHVTATADGDNATYTLSGETSATPAAAGNLVIKDGVEYIFSDKSKKWEQFGDEGNTATTAYVDNKILSVTNTYKTAAHLSLLPTTNNVVGDVAVVSAEIGESTGKYQHTAYYWNGTAWAAMDGNYDAETVYFNEDLTYTNAIGAIAAPSGSGTLAAKGKNLEEVLKSILAKEASGTTTQPSLTINTSTQAVEYGSTQTPSYSFTFNHGSYQYGPSPTGTEITAWQVKTNGNALTIASTADTVTNAGVACNPAQITATYTGNALTASVYQISANCSYTAGATPKTNIGNDDTNASKKIAAGSKTGSRYLYTVGKPLYWKITTTPTPNVTTFNANSTTGWTKIINGSLKTSWSCPANWYEMFFLMPSGQKTSWSGKDSNNVDVAVDTKGSVAFTYLNGDTATYDLFVVRNAAPYSATTVTMTFK